MPTLSLLPASTSDYRTLAEKRLPRFLFDYIDGGAYDETTLRANVGDLQSIRLRQKVMRDVSAIDTKIEILGERWAFPTALAPVGMAGMMARRAELQAVRSADAFGIPFCLSSASICSLEEVAKVAKRPFWFQLYMMRDRGAVLELLDRAKAVGCKTLVFTVDLAVVGARYRDVRNAMAGGGGLWPMLRGRYLECAMHPRWAYDVGLRGRPHIFGNIAPFLPRASSSSIDDFVGWIGKQFDPGVTWKDIAWLRSVWPGNLVIKGILDPDDAASAVDAGADAVIVSNHGGRQLDGVSSAITILPRVVDRVGDRAPVMMDGGVRSGLDVVKALACGAKATLIGRPWIWSLAAKGEAGLIGLLRTFKGEMKVGLGLTGVPAAADVDAAVLDR
ncbi:L-lactate dehydrogenase [Sphingobium subterraneum]|uniref:L-lactate dehydrogenase (Cytochrome) n=1 Tax=Sphingobium subterraneum TaxID=627688 RepID=A0A841IXK4_9SPHN|nr:L-lactate dehydrogenase [Sphingobium subterraneum]MBB6123393.1 L-lactate dehydrogenase (cytochrome) [Sphingobium subterraneum]